MENPRPEKVAVVDEVRRSSSSGRRRAADRVPRAERAALAELRRALRPAGAEYKVYKNTLVRFAAQELAWTIQHLLTGPTAIAFVPTKDEARAMPPRWPRRCATSPRATRPWCSRAALLGDTVLTGRRKALADPPDRS